MPTQCLKLSLIILYTVGRKLHCAFYIQSIWSTLYLYPFAWLLMLSLRTQCLYVCQIFILYYKWVCVWVLHAIVPYLYWCLIAKWQDHSLINEGSPVTCRLIQRGFFFFPQSYLDVWQFPGLWHPTKRNLTYLNSQGEKVCKTVEFYSQNTHMLI